MSLPAFSVRTLQAEEAAACIEALAAILIDCVEDGASVNFMAPLARPKALAFWNRIVDDLHRGQRLLLVAEDIETRSLAGTAQLVLGHPENQPHRADVAKVLVGRDWRRRGIGESLMTATEAAARRLGKTLLVLDTTHGSAAERLYHRLGWTRLGTMPRHALLPDGRMSDTTYFYKHLA